MPTSFRTLWLGIMIAPALLGGVACQRTPSAPSVLPSGPSSLVSEWSAGAISTSASVALSACLSASSPSCFTAPRTQAATVGAEPVTGPPLNLTAAVNGTTVTLIWTPPGFQDAPVISYIIDVGSTPNFGAPDLVSIDTFSTSTTLEVSGVPAGTYYVRIRARNALGISAASNEIQVVVGIVVVPGPGCPGPPRSLTGAGSVGTVTLSWQPPLSGAVQSYLLEAGSATGAANLATLNNGLSTVFSRSGVPAGIYYLRVRALASGCPPSAASNELVLTVTGASTPNPGNPLVTLSLVYTCNPCTGDPDNYALNVDCVAGRCTSFRTSNATRSGTVTASVRMGPGVHNVEVVARVSSAWTLTISASPPGSGGMVPGSWRVLYPSGGAGLSLQPCRITSTFPEPFVEFMVSGGSGTC